MKITKEEIKALKPCREAWCWYLNTSSQTEDLEDLLIETNEKEADWAGWLFTNLMTQKQCVEITIFTAEHVLPVFEAEYPKDRGPMEAIEAARVWMKNPTEENRERARKAAHAASASASASASAYAAYAATYAAYAVACAYIDPDVVGDGGKELQIKIIKEAVRILERDNLG
jgi:hypothetical protein